MKNAVSDAEKLLARTLGLSRGCRPSERAPRPRTLHPAAAPCRGDSRAQAERPGRVRWRTARPRPAEL